MSNVRFIEVNVAGVTVNVPLLYERAGAGRLYLPLAPNEEQTYLMNNTVLTNARYIEDYLTNDRRLASRRNIATTLYMKYPYRNRINLGEYKQEWYNLLGQRVRNDIIRPVHGFVFPNVNTFEEYQMILDTERILQLPSLFGDRGVGAWMQYRSDMYRWCLATRGGIGARRIYVNDLNRLDTQLRRSSFRVLVEQTTAQLFASIFAPNSTITQYLLGRCSLIGGEAFAGLTFTVIWSILRIVQDIATHYLTRDSRFDYPHLTVQEILSDIIVNFILNDRPPTLYPILWRNYREVWVVTQVENHQVPDTNLARGTYFYARNRYLSNCIGLGFRISPYLLYAIIEGMRRADFGNNLVNDAVRSLIIFDRTVTHPNDFVPLLYFNTTFQESPEEMRWCEYFRADNSYNSGGLISEAIEEEAVEERPTTPPNPYDPARRERLRQALRKKHFQEGSTDTNQLITAGLPVAFGLLVAGLVLTLLLKD